MITFEYIWIKLITIAKASLKRTEKYWKVCKHVLCWHCVVMTPAECFAPVATRHHEGAEETMHMAPQAFPSFWHEGRRHAEHCLLVWHCVRPTVRFRAQAHFHHASQININISIPDLLCCWDVLQAEAWVGKAVVKETYDFYWFLLIFHDFSKHSRRLESNIEQLKNYDELRV